MIVDNFTLTGIITTIAIAIFLLGSGNRTRNPKSSDLTSPEKPGTKNQLR